MRHGDLYRDGDEFNREPWYHCFKCKGAHGRDVVHCGGLREMPIGGTFSGDPDPYGVPTGVVPRRYPFDQRDHIVEDLTEKLMPGDATVGVKPCAIQQAVDDYLLMERKAKAWDTLRQRLFPSEARVHAVMDELLKPPA